MKYIYFFKGQIPNSFLYNERLKLKTEMCYRIKDPEINYSFTLEVNSAKDLEFDLDLYFRNFNSQDKEHIYNDNKIASIYINLFEIYSQLQNKKEIIISHSFNEYTSVMIKYSLFPNINNCEFTQTVNTHYNGEKNEELEDNEFLTNELIENFHKTLNEINNDICVIDNFLPSNQKALSHNIDNTNNNKPKLHTQKKELEEIDESPQKLEKTIVFIKKI